MITERLEQPDGLGWQPGMGKKWHLYRAGDVVVPTDVSSRYWNASGWWGDQGNTSECTIFSWLHVLHDGPITHRNWKKPVEDPKLLYQFGQQIDGTPLSDVNSGLTSDAAAQVFLKRGYIGEYRWALDFDEMLDCLLNAGPGTLGMWWPTGMDSTDSTGRAHYTGSDRGGHQIKVDGANKHTRLIRFKQSWGRSNYGRNGFGYISFDDAKSILKDGGEFCIARELLDRAAAAAALPTVAP